jgi:hypothetical protein
MPDAAHAANQRAGLSDAELAAEQGTELPERDAMSMIDLGLPWNGIDNLAMPINQAFAANFNTNQSIANADADQVVVIDQAADEDAGERR